MFILFIIFNCFITFDFYAGLHEFHLSRTEINYDSQTHEVQIAVHLFIDDFESALTKSGSKKLYLCTPKEVVSADDDIEMYINKNMIVYISGQPIPATLLGKETSQDKMAVWCYLEISNVKNIAEVTIENKLLIELFNDQKNITDFTVNKKRNSFIIFDSDKTKEKIALK